MSPSPERKRVIHTKHNRMTIWKGGAKKGTPPKGVPSLKKAASAVKKAPETPEQKRERIKKALIAFANQYNSEIYKVIDVRIGKRIVQLFDNDFAKEALNKKQVYKTNTEKTWEQFGDQLVAIFKRLTAIGIAARRIRQAYPGNIKMQKLANKAVADALRISNPFAKNTIINNPKDKPAGRTGTVRATEAAKLLQGEPKSPIALLFREYKKLSAKPRHFKLRNRMLVAVERTVSKKVELGQKLAASLFAVVNPAWKLTLQNRVLKPGQNPAKTPYVFRLGGKKKGITVSIPAATIRGNQPHIIRNAILSALITQGVSKKFFNKKHLQAISAAVTRGNFALPGSVHLALVQVPAAAATSISARPGKPTVRPGKPTGVSVTTHRHGRVIRRRVIPGRRRSVAARQFAVTSTKPHRHYILNGKLKPAQVQARVEKLRKGLKEGHDKHHNNFYILPSSRYTLGEMFHGKIKVPGSTAKKVVKEMWFQSSPTGPARRLVFNAKTKQFHFPAIKPYTFASRVKFYGGERVHLTKPKGIKISDKLPAGSSSRPSITVTTTPGKIETPDTAVSLNVLIDRSVKVLRTKLLGTYNLSFASIKVKPKRVGGKIQYVLEIKDFKGKTGAITLNEKSIKAPWPSTGYPRNRTKIAKEIFSFIKSHLIGKGLNIAQFKMKPSEYRATGIDKVKERINKMKSAKLKAAFAALQKAGGIIRALDYIPGKKLTIVDAHFPHFGNVKNLDLSTGNMPNNVAKIAMAVKNMKKLYTLLTGRHGISIKPSLNGGKVWIEMKGPKIASHAVDIQPHNVDEFTAYARTAINFMKHTKFNIGRFYFNFAHKGPFTFHAENPGKRIVTVRFFRTGGKFLLTLNGKSAGQFVKMADAIPAINAAAAGSPSAVKAKPAAKPKAASRPKTAPKGGTRTIPGIPFGGIIGVPTAARSTRSKGGAPKGAPTRAPRAPRARIESARELSLTKVKLLTAVSKALQKKMTGAVAYMKGRYVIEMISKDKTKRSGFRVEKSEIKGSEKILHLTALNPRKAVKVVLDKTTHAIKRFHWDGNISSGRGSAARFVTYMFQKHVVRRAAPAARSARPRVAPRPAARPSRGPRLATNREIGKTLQIITQKFDGLIPGLDVAVIGRGAISFNFPTGSREGGIGDVVTHPNKIVMEIAFYNPSVSYTVTIDKRARAIRSITTDAGVRFNGSQSSLENFARRIKRVHRPDGAPPAAAAPKKPSRVVRRKPATRPTLTLTGYVTNIGARAKVQQNIAASLRIRSVKTSIINDGPNKIRVGMQLGSSRMKFGTVKILKIAKYNNGGHNVEIEIKGARHVISLDKKGKFSGAVEGATVFTNRDRYIKHIARNIL